MTRIRSGIVQLPSAMAFGAAGRPDLTEAAWHAAGTELAAVGINVDFAPDADVIALGRQHGDRLPLVRRPTRRRSPAQVAAAVTGPAVGRRGRHPQALPGPRPHHGQQPRGIARAGPDAWPR